MRIYPGANARSCTPYTYLIGWSRLNVWYYGVRYCRGCDPSDLWNPYKTSSKYVKNLIKIHGDPDVRQVRKVFACPDKAVRWEQRVLTRINASARPDWLNRTNGTLGAGTFGEKYYHPSTHEVIYKRFPTDIVPEEFVRGNPPTCGNLGMKMTEEFREKRRMRMTGNKIGTGGRGKPKTEEHKQKIREANRGKPKTEAQKLKQSLVMKAKRPTS